MKKRIKKKQSRLVAKWLAEHPEVTLKAPIVPHIKEYAVTPQKFSANQNFSRYEYNHFPNEREWDAHVRSELARCFLEVVANAIHVENIFQDERFVWYGATLDIVPHSPSRQDVDRMYEQQERDAFAELNHFFSERARQKELDEKVRMVRFNQTHRM